MTTQHTPGPWFRLTGGIVVTTTGPDWPRHIVAEVTRLEDARLIAAAPALLAALQELEKAAAAFAYSTHPDGIKSAPAALVWALDTARAAIQKATTERP